MNFASMIAQARPRVGMTVTREGVLYTITEVHSDCLVLVHKWREKPGSELRTETIKVPYNGPTE